MARRPKVVDVVIGVLVAAPAGAAAAAASDAALVAEATKGQLKGLKGQYYDKEFGAQVSYDAELVDLNADGQAEVFTRRHGAMFGRTGVEMNLYVKNKSGQWQPQFGFPGDYGILKTRHLGYPDIEILGPGTCFPVWRWNGSAYALHKSCAR
jgi:hypothetical protein